MWPHARQWFAIQSMHPSRIYSRLIGLFSTSSTVDGFLVFKEGLTLETPAFYTFHSDNSTFINSSLQITFSYKPVICQARDKVWPDMQPVWSDITFVFLKWKYSLLEPSQHVWSDSVFASQNPQICRTNVRCSALICRLVNSFDKTKFLSNTVSCVIISTKVNQKIMKQHPNLLVLVVVAIPISENGPNSLLAETARTLK